MRSVTVNGSMTAAARAFTMALACAGLTSTLSAQVPGGRAPSTAGGPPGLHAAQVLAAAGAPAAQSSQVRPGPSGTGTRITVETPGVMWVVALIVLWAMRKLNPVSPDAEPQGGTGDEAQA